MNDLIWGDDNIENIDNSIKDTSLYRSHNEVWFNCSINNDTINKLIKLMYEIIHDEKLSAYRESSSEIEIILHIDSPGGCVRSALKFVDFVTLLKKKNIKLRTIINGYAASAATIIAIIGDSKEITPNSSAMIHELSSSFSGNYTHIKSYSKHLDFLHTKIVDIYTTHKNPQSGHPTPLEKKEDINIEELLLKQTWMNADEYLQIGFVDKICE